MAEMQRYAALLRGVMPTNAKMSELKRSFEAAGFRDVKTVLGSGNVLFSAPAASESELARKAERAMLENMGRSFLTIVRPVVALRKLLQADPFADAQLPSAAKRVVTFLLKAPNNKVSLPDEVDGARIVGVRGSEVFCAYTPSPRGPVFMTLINKTFGDDVTTRTWDTLAKLAADGPASAPKSRKNAASTRVSAAAPRNAKAKAAAGRKAPAKRKKGAKRKNA